MRWIAPGAFEMGSPDSDEEAYDREQPQHQVTLTEGFWLAEAPCTQAVWQAVMADNPSRFEGAERPVEGISWGRVQALLSAINARVPGLEFQLPTEAQWEYACRAGTETPRYGPLGAVAWHSGESSGETHPVKQKPPNAWGLHDMLGNVWEWCRDGLRTYDGELACDPIGAVEPEVLRVRRGGSWSSPPRYVRAAYRYVFDPESRYSSHGFRLAGVGSSRRVR